jgi:hypothetical protein
VKFRGRMFLYDQKERVGRGKVRDGNLVSLRKG